MFLNLHWLHTPMATAPEYPGRLAEMEVVKVKSNEIHLGCLVSQTLPMVNA